MLFFGAQIGQTALNFVGEQRIFRQTLCAGIFSLDKQSLVKSTPGDNLMKEIGPYLRPN